MNLDIEQKSNSYDKLDELSKDELSKLLKRMLSGGISIMFHGKKTACEIKRKVRPRIMKYEDKLSIGNKNESAKNLLLEGENLQSMVTLYKYRGEIDLILTDPPYNTGKQFRYNDNWDKDPNDPDLGSIVTLEDGSRHTKWMKFMLPRIQIMKDMLKQGGILAICIDHNELFHLGMILDEIFGEENRVGIINWQKSYSPKNDNEHLSSGTEYVLIYANDIEKSNTNLLDRDELMNSRYKNTDNDPNGLWTGGDPTASRATEKDRYAIQSPFTGALHYPGAGAWRFTKKDIKAWLSEWGTEYVEKKLNDGRSKALVIKGAEYPTIEKNINLDDNNVIECKEVYESAKIVKSREIALDIMQNSIIPKIFFLKDGFGRPRYKRYLDDVKKGKVPLTFWADEDYEDIFEIGCQSWDYKESGHSQTGINELNNLIGKGHGFKTVKPLKLMKKIIQLWCPPNGRVLDCFAGSGTTGHAVLELNYETGTDRKFILIEQGSPENGDKYASTLTYDRLNRAINGNWEKTSKNNITEPLGGGFEFYRVLDQIDAEAILCMKKNDLIDVVLSSHFDNERRKSVIYRMEEEYTYLVAKNEKNEGIFIIWEEDSVGELNINTYKNIIKECKLAKLSSIMHIYARYEIYQSNSVIFYKIPDKVLAHLGLNEFNDMYNEEKEGVLV